MKISERPETFVYIYPLVTIPPLDQLYSDSNEFEDIRWKIFSWITSIDANAISIMTKLPKQFLLISATVFILVKVIRILHDCCVEFKGLCVLFLTE